MRAFAHTFSIIARDSATGQFGVGVQSHWFACASLVPWASPGVGAVATQSMVDTSYGTLGLELMRAGKSAQQALNALVCADEQAEIRQVAMIDREGKSAAHTGSRCIRYAGHIVGDGFSVQGNLLAGTRVWEDMAHAYETAKGDFSERLMQALEAAQDAGGDVRGRQSAGLLVVPSPDDPVRRDAVTNLRVDDSTNPLIDLRRLLTVQRGYEWHEQAIHAVNQGDMDAARRHYANLRGLAVGTREPHFWVAAAFLENGHTDDALPILSEVFKVEPVWCDMIEPLVETGFFPGSREILEAVNRVIAEVRGGK